MKESPRQRQTGVLLPWLGQIEVVERSARSKTCSRNVGGTVEGHAGADQGRQGLEVALGSQAREEQSR